MPSSSENERRSTATAIQRASQITTIAMSMALPPLGGVWLDSKWGTSPWMVIVGAFFGFTTGMMQLLRMSKGSGDTRGAPPQPPEIQ